MADESETSESLLLSEVEKQCISLLDLPQDNLSFVHMPGFADCTTRHLTGSEHKLGCYRLPGGVFVGAYAILFTFENRILNEQNAHTLVNESLLMKPVPCNHGCPQLQSAVSLVSAASYCFYHWILDSLPKVIVAEACGFSGTYIVPASNVNPWVKETMEMLGVSKERCLPMEYFMVNTNDLWIPTHFYGDQMYHPGGLFTALRDRLIGKAKHPLRSCDRIYIPRRFLHRDRRLVNQEEVESLLRRYGFQETLMENLPVKEQIGIAAQAHAIAGPHGSGMLHALFMPRESFMLEFFSTDVKMCMAHIAEALGHRYVAISSTEDPPPPDQGNIIVDCVRLKETLENSFQLSIE